MKRSRSWPNAKLLAALILLVGSLLGGILWLQQNAKAQSRETATGASGILSSPQSEAAAGSQSIVLAGLPRTCTVALRGDVSKSTGTNLSNDIQDSVRNLAERGLAIPVAGVEKNALYNSFTDGRGARKHEAIDIHAPRGTPVIATGDGCVVKLYRSVPGGIRLYQFDPAGNFSYYYAHLDRYADEVKEGMQVARGDILGYVGTTGNAAANAPHLHFAIYRLGPEKRWWAGTPINPYAVFTYR